MDINMEFGESDCRNPSELENPMNEEVGSFGCISVGPTLPCVQLGALAPDGLGTSESTSNIPATMSSILLAPPGLHRTLSTSLRMVHGPHEAFSTSDVQDMDGMDIRESDIFPVCAGSDTAISAPINIPRSRNSSGRANGQHAEVATSLPINAGLMRGYSSDMCQIDRLHLPSSSLGRTMRQLSNQSVSTPCGPTRQFSNQSAVSSMLSRGKSSIFGSSIWSLLFEAPISRRGSTASIPITNVVTETPSYIPILASEFLDDGSLTPVQLPAEFYARPSNGHFHAAASYQDKLDNFDRDKKKSELPELEDAADGLLKRSRSVPPKYEYHPQTKSKLAHVKDIFQDFLPKDDETGIEKEEPEGISDQKLLAAQQAKKKWQQNLPEIIEGPESETLTSQSSGRVLLAKAALAIVHGDYGDATKTELATWKEVEELDEEIDVKLERRKYWRNLIALSISFFFIFTAYLSLRNLQSSLNASGGLGLYSLSSLYACFFVGCIFATTIVQRLRPKRTMLFATVGLFLYDLANFHPTFYTLIPTSSVVGFCLGIMWTAHATYLANISSNYAELTGKKLQHVLQEFNSIFFVFYQSSQIVGGLISSLVLASKTPINSSQTLDNSTSLEELNLTSFEGGSFVLLDNDLNLTENVAIELCGVDYCPRQSTRRSGGGEVDKVTIYILMGIFTACSIVGMVVMFVFVDRLEGTMKKSHATLGKQLGAVFKFFFDRRVVCLIGLMLYSMLQTSFMFGEFTKAYVTCSLGVHMVGYVMVSLSASSATSSYLNSKIQQRIGRFKLIIAATFIQTAMIVTLLLWKPSPSTTSIFFIIVIFWGMADSIIVTQTISLIGVLFSDNREPAFAALKMTQSMSNFSFFITSPYLCTRVKIIIVGVVLLCATGGYVTLEAILRLDKKKQAIIIIEKDVKSSEPA